MNLSVIINPSVLSVTIGTYLTTLELEEFKNQREKAAALRL